MQRYIKQKEVKMLTVTESAKQELKKILSVKIDSPQYGLRLITSGPSGQYGFCIDKEMPGDHVVEYKGSKVLLVEHDMAERLAELTLDTHDTPEGTRLKLLRLVPKE